MLNISLSFVLACLVSLYAVPAVIKIAYLKRLYDDPALEARKIHKYRIPNLGGLAVLAPFAFVSCLFVPGNVLPYANYIFAAGLLVFSMGMMDDLAGLDPYKKFLAQFISAFIIVYFGDIRISSFDGLLGIYQLHPAMSYAFSSLLVVFIINAFNLIDGINGLLGSVSLISSLTLGVLFFKMGQSGLAVLAFSLAGAVLAFLRYNMGHARVFMGDAGAYTIGLMAAVLIMRFVELNIFSAAEPSGDYTVPVVQSAPAVAVAILIIPVFDTLRVFIMRIAAGKSPFLADRRHLHHRLLDIGMDHTQATVTLAAVNIFMIAIAVAFQQAGTTELMLFIGIVALFFNALLWLYDVKLAYRQQSTTETQLREREREEALYRLKTDSKQLAEEAIQELEGKQRRN